MSTLPGLNVIRKIKKAHENISIAIGVIIGMILLTYFFTFAQLVDKGYTGSIIFETVSSVVLVIGLIFVKQLSFSVVKLLYGGRSTYRPFLTAIKVSDLTKDEKLLLERFGL